MERLFYVIKHIAATQDTVQRLFGYTAKGVK